jgi:ABC-2 type transport system ATP-binding protein
MLAVHSLTKRFGKTVAVDDLSFEVAAGRIMGFLGPNGAGKTTTLRSMLGLCVPTSGSATIDGRRYAQLRDPIRRVGAVLDGPQFHPGRSGRNHLRALALGAGLPRSRVEEVLVLVELVGAADRRVKGYSQGMRQRLSLAAALLGDPQALILDEPANGLDPQGIRWLRDFLRSLGAEGRTILVSSHVLAEIAQTVDEVVVIHRGRLVTAGSVDELTRGARARVLVRSPAAERLAEALAAKGIEAERLDGDLLVGRNTSGEAIGTTAAEQGIALYELTPQGSTLEDVFLELTADEPGGSG